MSYITFTSLKFILFLAAVFVFYFVYPHKFRWIIMLIANVVFYCFAGWDKLIIMLATSAIVWLCAYITGRIYEKADADYAALSDTGNISKKPVFMAPYKKRCKKILTAAVVIIIAILCYCKFAEKTLVAIQRYLKTGGYSINVIVPLGISYYTFSSIGYIVDVYYRKQPCIKNYFKLLLCLSYFPHIVEGPISRYNELLIQFETEHRFDIDRICRGIQRMLWGYFKKLVIADRIAIMTSTVYADSTSYEGLICVIAIILSRFQLYADFSGCMDIAIGASEIFGITLDENFNHPFFAKSYAEYWRRWHMTLGRWFKDYIYMPISASHKMIGLYTKISRKYGRKAAKNVITAVPLFVVWILTGIWHGTGRNYVYMGLWCGFVIITSTIFAENYQRLSEKLNINTGSKEFARFQMIRTFLVGMVSSVFTAPGTISYVKLFVKQMFKSFNPWIFWDGSLYKLGLDYRNICVFVIGILIMWKVSRLQENTGRSVRDIIAGKNIAIRWAIWYLLIFGIIILGIYGPGYDASSFAYENF